MRELGYVAKTSHTAVDIHMFAPLLLPIKRLQEVRHHSKQNDHF